MRRTSFVAWSALLALLVGNGFAFAADNLPEPRPLGRDLLADVSVSEVATVSENLTLRKALSLVLLRNPELPSALKKVRTREALALQTGLLPNPEMEAEFENVFGSGEFEGTDAAETTIVLSQLIELGGKRHKRLRAASLEAELAGWDYEAARLEVLTRATRSFVRVLAAQQRVTQAAEVEKLAERFYQTVSDRVEAGKVSPVEKTRARVTLSTARVALDRAGLALAEARESLAALWGSGEPTFEQAVGSLEQVSGVPSRQVLLGYLDQNPRLARWQTAEKQRRAALERERAGAIPDLTLGLGMRKEEVSGDHSFLAGFSIPLPVFDRNQGGITAARSELSRIRHQRQGVRNELRGELARSYKDLAAAFNEVTTLQEEILPSARSAFEATELGYKEGKFDFLQVLDAQRTLFDVKGQYVEALAAYHLARTEVERLLARPLETIPGSNATGATDQ